MGDADGGVLEDEATSWLVMANFRSDSFWIRPKSLLGTEESAFFLLEKGHNDGLKNG